MNLLIGKTTHSFDSFFWNNVGIGTRDAAINFKLDPEAYTAANETGRARYRAQGIKALLCQNKPAEQTEINKVLNVNFYMDNSHRLRTLFEDFLKSSEKSEYKNLLGWCQVIQDVILKQEETYESRGMKTKKPLRSSQWHSDYLSNTRRRGAPVARSGSITQRLEEMVIDMSDYVDDPNNEVHPDPLSAQQNAMMEEQMERETRNLIEIDAERLRELREQLGISTQPRFYTTVTTTTDTIPQPF